jgi:Seven in absentia protein family.
MASSSKHVDLQLLRELECPVCHEYMEPPIILCEKGHNICYVCKPKVNACGLCRSNYLSTQNLTLENIARFCMYPCKNQEEGCAETMTLTEKQSHLKYCVYQTRVCPFTKIFKAECSWEGLLSEMKEHVLNDHGFETDTRKEDGEFDVHLKDFGPSESYFASVTKFGEHFSVLCKTTVWNFYCAVIITGDKKKASEYKYRLTIKTADHIKYTCSDINVQSICMDYEDIMDSFKCAAFLYMTVDKFQGTDKVLICNMDIYKEHDLTACEDPPKKIPYILARHCRNKEDEEYA